MVEKKLIFLIHLCHDKGKNIVPCITLLVIVQEMLLLF